MLQGLDKAAGGLSRLAAIIGTIGLTAEVVVILIDVVGRYFGSPLRGAQDLSQMGMAIIVFGGMALCERTGGHISVDIFEQAFGDRVNRALEITSALVGAVIFALIAWKLIESAALSRMLNLATNIIRLPKDWFQYFVAACSIITAAAMLLRAAALMAGRPEIGRESET